jgi:hypothetical protein
MHFIANAASVIPQAAKLKFTGFCNTNHSNSVLYITNLIKCNFNGRKTCIRSNHLYVLTRIDTSAHIRTVNIPRSHVQILTWRPSASTDVFDVFLISSLKFSNHALNNLRPLPYYFKFIIHSRLNIRIYTV